MQRIPLKDKDFITIAFLEIKDNGDKILKDKNFITLGFYFSDRDVTMNDNLITIGHGDILTSLLK